MNESDSSVQTGNCMIVINEICASQWLMRPKEFEPHILNEFYTPEKKEDILE